MADDGGVPFAHHAQVAIHQGGDVPDFIRRRREDHLELEIPQDLHALRNA